MSSRDFRMRQTVYKDMGMVVEAEFGLMCIARRWGNHFNN